MFANIRFVVPLLSLLGCAARTSGAEPHDMSAAAHEEEASREEREAAAHQEQYDPNATVTRTQCPYSGSQRPICWTSVANPTEAHLQEADRHRKMAADHRAASSELRQAEAVACVGIDPEDRDMSPFEHAEDVVGVAPLTSERPGAQKGKQVDGAVVTLRPVPGLTVVALQHLVDCHLARDAALGHVVPEMPDCPLVPMGARATVSQGPEGLRVEITSDDPAAAADILARAQRLVGAHAANP